MASTTFSISNGISRSSLSSIDQTKVTSVQLSAQFDPARDFAEASIYNNRGIFVATTAVSVGLNTPSAPQDPNQSNEDRDLVSSNIFIDPLPLIEALPDSEKNGATARYSFFRSILTRIEVDEISYDRTEVKLKVTAFSRPQEQINNLVNLVVNSNYLSKVGISLERGDYLPIINVSDDGEYVYLKLYKPLPNLVNLGDPITINQEVADPISVTFSYTPDAPIVVPQPSLRGPNFNIDLEDRSTVTTEYLDYNELYTLPVTNSYNRIFSELEGSGIDISVDYTQLENFVHFSSAKERLANFKYKLDLLHQYESERLTVQNLSNASNAITSSNTYYDGLIKGILEKFDGYERFLYYESSSKAWPKSNTQKPYLNSASSTVAATSWYNAEFATASLYDELNESNLEYTIPEFIRQDDTNAPYSLFLNMIGQHFDELWLYAKGITSKYNADNRLDYGISKDLIVKTLQGLGVKLYSSNFSANSLTSLFLGEWYDSGSEHPSTSNQTFTFVTASNEPTPDKDLLAETYKRLYHNLPYLLKTKGTERGLRALINCFGIPSSSLSIEVLGGTTREDESYFGYELATNDKIRLNNTGSIIPGNTLSQFISIIKPVDKYNQDLNIIEVGFSPTKWMDEYIVQNLPGNYMVPLNYAYPFLDNQAYVRQGDFNIDDYIGDPRHRTAKSYNTVVGWSLKDKATAVLSDSGSYDVKDFIRLTKFFDNQLFKMVKDFVPARDVVASGIIIKPNILNRNKVKVPDMTYTRHEHTGSIDTAFITGSAAGIINSHSTAYSASVLTPSGSITKIYDDEAAKFTGELGGTVLDLYSGSLNEANELKKPSTIEPLYEASGSYGTDPSSGFFNWQEGIVTGVQGGVGVIFGEGVVSMYINEVDGNGTNLENVLTNLKPGDELKFTIRYDLYDNNALAPLNNPQNVTLTQTIETITRYSPTVWFIQFTESSIRILATQDPLRNFSLLHETLADTTVFFNPFLNVPNIDYHPYNALLNNASNISNKTFLQEVDYNAGSIVPSNIEQIRNNTAVRAEVNEYIHNSAGMVSGKYTGKQLKAQYLSEFVAGDKSYGKAPVIYYNDKYFAYAPDLETTDPLLVGKTQYSLRYLIDDNGEVIDLTSVDLNRNHVNQNFREQHPLKVRLQNPRITSLGKGPNYYLTAEANVFKSGKRVELILGSEYRLGAKTTGTMQFEGTGVVSNYYFFAYKASGQQALTDTYQIAQINGETRDKGNPPTGNYNHNFVNSTQYKYIFHEDTDAKVKFVFSGAFNNTSLKKQEAHARIIKKSGGITEVLGEKSIEIPGRDYFFGGAYIIAASFGGGIEIDTAAQDFLEDDEVYVEIKGSNKVDFVNVSINPKTYQSFYTTFSNTQTPKANDALNITGLWTTGSNSRNILTGSVDLLQYYGTSIQEPLSGSTYPSASIPFTVQVGDEFRFSLQNSVSSSAVEIRSFAVTDVTTVPQIYATLNEEIPVSASLDLDSFILRRYVDDSTSLITDQKKIAGDTSPAFLLPKYAPEGLDDKLNRIIKDLVGQNLI